MKFTLLRYFVLVFVISCHTIYCQNFDYKNFDPKTTLIISDIDDVVIKNREYNFLSWLAYPTNWSFALTLNKVKNKYHLYDPEKILEKVVELYPKFTKKAEDFKKQLINAKTIQGTLYILRNLQNKGYTILPQSNMAKSTYLSLRDHQILPHDLFPRHFYFVKTKKQNKKNDGSYYKKPAIQFFEHLKNYIEKKYPQKFKNIILIDNERKNTEAAKKVGFTAIRFKNARQLQRKLKYFGITF